MKCSAIFALLLVTCFGHPAIAQQEKFNVAQAIDRYIDSRFDAAPDATRNLIEQLQSNGVAGVAELEKRLRAPRNEYPDVSELVGKTSSHEVKCLHVDYESKFLLYVPADYKPGKIVPLVIVGHGGNSSMSPQRATSTAAMYLRLYAPAVSKELGAIVVAPASTRGWGQIGNSLIFSTVSKLQRMFPIDPDRIYVTGQSMGGHLSYRSALTLPDRWGAVSPQSGGYDFVAKKSIGNLLNVPGYVTWGKTEPYGINKDNRTNAAWGETHGLDWTFVEKNGGHTIYQDELPKMAKFFGQHPRNLFRKTVYLRMGGDMKFVKTWQIKGWPEHKVFSDSRPLRWNLRHWVEVQPRSEIKEPQELMARNLGDNRIEITCNQVRQLRVLLHPKMVDFEKPISIKINGEQMFNDMVQPDPTLMLDLAREFDDRGRTYWAAVDLEATSDEEIEIPVVPSG